VASLAVRLGIALCAFVLIGANDGAFGVLLPSLRDYYHADKATISLLFLSGTLGYISAAVGSGPLADRLGMRLFLVSGAGTFMLGAGVFSLMPPFLVGLSASFLIGFGVAIIDAGLNAYIAALPNNSTLLNFLHAFYGLGALAGPIVASAFLLSGWGWNSVYALWVSVALLLLAGFVMSFGRTTPEPRPETQTQQQRPPASGPEALTSNVLGAVLRLRVVWLAALFLMFYVGSEVSLGSWSYSLLTEERGRPELLSSWAVSGFWMGLTVGRAALAALVKHLGNTRTIELCLLGVAAGMLAVWLVPATWVEVGGLWLAGFSLGPIFPTTIALISQLVPARLLPGSIGFLASLGSVGAALFPWLAGNIAQWFGLWLLMPYVIALAAIMLAFWFALPKTRE
jgi:fucose permease